MVGGNDRVTAGCRAVWSSFTLTLPDPPPVLAARLRAALSGPSRPYSGRITDDGFRVTRVRRFGERTPAFVATGRFEPTTGGGTAVLVTLRPGTFDLVVVAAALGAAVVVPWQAMRRAPGPAADTLFFPCLMFACPALMLFSVFVYSVCEERTYQRDLGRLLAAPAGGDRYPSI